MEIAMNSKHRLCKRRLMAAEAKLSGKDAGMTPMQTGRLRNADCLTDRLGSYE